MSILLTRDSLSLDPHKQLYQLMELPETNKSSAADEPENKEKANWMQVREVREAIVACSRASYVM
jgi:hypothetical protein